MLDDYAGLSTSQPHFATAFKTCHTATAYVRPTNHCLQAGAGLHTAARTHGTAGGGSAGSTPQAKNTDYAVVSTSQNEGNEMQRAFRAESPLKHKHANGAADASATTGGRVKIPGLCLCFRLSYYSEPVFWCLHSLSAVLMCT